MAEKPTPPSNPIHSGPSAGQTGRPDVDRALLLRDVMDHAVRIHKETSGPFGEKKRSHARTTTLAVVIVAVVALCAYSWIAKPEFIWGPKPGPLPLAQQDANLRFAMFLVAQRVEAHRLAQGALPSSLEAIGEGLPGVTYTAVSEKVFELRGSVNGQPVVYRSDASANAFLGNSTNIIQGIAR